MNCPSCGREIKGMAVVCPDCGVDLPIQSDVDLQGNTIPLGVKLKSPFLAVLLNCFILMFGLGYIYLGLWGRWAIVFSLQLFTAFPMRLLGIREYNPYLLLVIWTFTLFDAYFQAKKINEKRISVA